MKFTKQLLCLGLVASWLTVVCQLAVPSPAAAQFATPVVDGVIIPGEYGPPVNGQNQQASGSTTWSMTWDSINLYIGISGANTAEGAIIYLDKNPIAPINGGTNSNGTLVGQLYDNTNFAALQFRADLVLYVKSGYREYRTADNANGWSAPNLFFGPYAETAGTVREFLLPWSAIGGQPASFAWFGYVTSGGGFVYSQVPTENSGASIGTSARYDRYYTVSSTANGASTKPFSRNSYVFNSTSDITGFGAISVYDFTMNSSGRTLTRGSGDWNIAGNLRIDSGTMSFGSTTSGATVSGDVIIGSGGVLGLSSVSGSSLTLNGSFTNSGTFAANASNITIGGTVGNPSIAGFSTTGALSFTRTAGTATLAGAVTASSLTVNGTGGGLSLGAGLTHQINGAVTIAAGTLSGGSSTLGLTGNWTYNGTNFNSGTGTVIFNGTSPQTIGGSRVSSFYNLTVNNPSGVSLGYYQFVYGTLALTTGNLSLGSYGLDLQGPGGGISVSGARSITDLGTNGVAVRIFDAKTISGSGTLTFATSVVLYASVDFGPSISTINDNLTILSGGAVINNAPIYGANSSLTYGSGGTYARGLEWSATSGAGAPYSVSVYQIPGNSATTLNYASGNPAANSIPGSLQINPGGTFDMGTANSPLTVGGSVAIFGTLTLSSVPGGDLRVLGFYWQNDGGTFNSNGRTVTLESTSISQSIIGTVGTTFADLTINNSSVGGVSLGNSQTVNGTLTLTRGRVSLGAYNLTIASDNAIAGGPFDGTKMIDADGAGALCKRYTAIGSFQFPVGDRPNVGSGTDYSPVTLNFTGGSFAGDAQACVRVTDAKQPNNPSTTNFLTRYWTVTQSGISSFSADTTFTYVNADIVGTESSIYTGKWNGTTWSVLSPANTADNTIGGTVNSFSDFTGGDAGPLAVTLADFSAVQQGDAVLLTWETNSELNNRGFNLYRGTSGAAPDRQLNGTLIPSQSQGNPGGFIYTWEDRTDLVPGTTYYYWVEDVDVNGVATMHGPVSVDYTVPTAVTLRSLDATTTAGSGVPLAGMMLALLALSAGALVWQRRRA